MASIDVHFQAHEGPAKIGWRPMSAIPRHGKILILNFNRGTGSLFVSTAYMDKEMPLSLRADYLKWAVLWAEFPDIAYDVIDGDKQLA